MFFIAIKILSTDSLILSFSVLTIRLGFFGISYGESIPVRKLAEAFGQGDLPVKEYTPGEVDDNVADISIMLSTGWKPKINILDTV